jgi:hypothetical protein
MVTAGLVEHLESFLGEIEVGWSKDADGFELPFQVVRFTPGALSGCVVFSTLGLSVTSLPSRRSGERIRHEFIMIVPERLREGPVPGLLQQVGLDVLASGSAVLRGDVLGPRGPLFEMSMMEALYAAIPVYLPDEFGQFRDVVIAWLVPVARSEADYVAVHGWGAFEERLIDVDPDLTAIDRIPMFA